MKKMLFTAFFFAISFISFAQAKPDTSREGKGKKIKAIYVAYMTQELSLTETEAQSFWPVVNEYDKEMKAAHKAETDELVREESILNIRKRYQDRFVKIIGKDRANLFYRKDAEFKKRLVDKVKEIRKQGKGQGGGKRRNR